MKTKILAFVTLFSFWGLLSGFNEPVQFLFGFLVSLLVIVWLNETLLKNADFGSFNKGFIKAYFLFLMLWIKDLILANIEVAQIVLSKDMNINPAFYRMPQPQKSVVNQTIIANAITLTPGTLTVAFDDESILVHALRSHHYDDLKTSKTFKYLKDTEKTNE